MGEAEVAGLRRCAVEGKSQWQGSPVLIAEERDVYNRCVLRSPKQSSSLLDATAILGCEVLYGRWPCVIVPNTLVRLMSMSSFPA